MRFIFSQNCAALDSIEVFSSHRRVYVKRRPFCVHMSPAVQNEKELKVIIFLLHWSFSKYDYYFWSFNSENLIMPSSGYSTYSFSSNTRGQDCPIPTVITPGLELCAKWPVKVMTGPDWQTTWDGEVDQDDNNLGCNDTSKSHWILVELKPFRPSIHCLISQ